MTISAERDAAPHTTSTADAYRSNDGLSRILVELSSDGIFIVNERGEVLDCNAAACRIYGYRRDELIGLAIAELVPPEVAVTLPDATFPDTDGRPAESRGRRKDGTRFPLEIATRSYEADGERRLVAYVRDITSQKRDAALLNAKTSVMEAISRGAPLGQVLDQLVCAMEEQIPGMIGSILLRRNDRLWTTSAPNLPENYSRAIDGLRIGPMAGSCGTAAFLNELVVVSDIANDPRWESHGRLALEHGLRACWSQPITDSNGEVLGTFATYYDEVRSPAQDEVKLVEQMANLAGIAIARTRAATALKESERRFRALVESIQEVIVILDRNGITRYASPAIEAITGYTIEERVGRHSFELIHPDDLDSVRANFDELLAEPGGRLRREIRIQHKNGSWRKIDLLAQNLLHDPYVRGIVVTYQDITAQRRLEEQLRESQKLEAVGRLAGGVAHDFNNILNIIGGIAHLTLDSLAEESPLREEMQEIIAAVDQGAGLTQQLLAFSRRQVLQPRILDLRQEIVEMARMLRRVIGEDIELVTKIESTGHVKADPGQMSQVLMNLAVNSRDAMPNGGVLTIATRDVDLDDVTVPRHPDSIQPGSYIEITVHDTGCGMDEHTLAHLFEPFFTTKGPGKGNGLGLSTVYGIVRQSGGSIHVESTPSAGTTFRILLPRVAPAPRPAPPAAPQPSNANGETVLLVEDAPVIRTVTRRILENNGYRVIEAADGETALRIADEHQGGIDLVLTDIIMPGMSGTVLAHRLLDRYPGLPIVYMSGYTSDQVITDDLRHDRTYFLQKPFAPDRLVRIVKEVMEGSRTRGDEAG